MKVRFDNLVQLYRETCEAHADLPALGTKRGGEWRWTTYRELAELVDRTRGGLAALGVRPEDRVAIISNNRLEWAAACYATYGLEAAFVPMYEAQLPKEWKHILNDSEARVVLVADERIFGILESMLDELPNVQRLVGLHLPREDERSFAALLAMGDAAPVGVIEPPPDAVAGFIYTSGTTGLPKGVILTHHNIASNVSAVSEIFPIESRHRLLSFLPWAHSYGQTAELHYLLSQGASAAINDDLANLLENLADVKPTILVAVPRIFNRIYDVVHKQVAERPGVIQRMFRDGIVAAGKRSQGEPLRLSEKIELSLDDKLIFRKIRARFGGRLEMVFSASAAMNREVAEFIDALGIMFYEGYGLSETSPVVSINRPGDRRIGSVGKVIPGVELRIDGSVSDVPGEGEIIVHGPNVMRGYHNRPDENARVFTSDGGFRTGDLGHVDADGFLYITGRIKEQYKLENGKYVAPSAIEEQLKLSPYINQIMIEGTNKPFNVALIVVDVESLDEYCEEEGIPKEGRLENPQVRELISDELKRWGNNLKGYEHPRKFALIDEEFTPENDMLTPTLKLKRRIIMQEYGDVIEDLYDDAR